ncbi:uncharacterized protein LOC111318390 isoform X4 [Durio zibethinus]|uniref:Uncharacterized protein LOC111318390 isoform X4 n=1 Tax=Durio zibethinus TaxID=66656 RepID=A0A6P6BIS9_DURZI|nr:uncharacterized protein LOC111318390 isoform X4 [Durio zibethinus]
MAVVPTSAGRIPKRHRLSCHGKVGCGAPCTSEASFSTKHKRRPFSLSCYHLKTLSSPSKLKHLKRWACSISSSVTTVGCRSTKLFSLQIFDAQGVKGE